MHIKSRPARQSGFFVLLPSLCQTPLCINPLIRIYLCRSAGLSTPLPVLRLERQVSSWGRRTGGSREADASTAKRGPQRRRLRLEVERPRSSAFLRNTAWEGTAQFFLYLHQKPTKMTKSAFLFDLDGVILDTEGHYTEFWDGIGADYLGDPHLAAKLKGETIATSLMRCFPDDEQKREEVRARLYEFEANMKYEYVPGAHEFLTSLKAGGYPTAIVTSSNRDKMAQVYKSRPEIREMVDHVLTCDDFSRSKPAPDCYILGMKTCGSSPENTFIFEDSFNGLKSARDSGGHVVALATTNSRESVAPYADIVVDNFVGMTAARLLKHIGAFEI